LAAVRVRQHVNPLSRKYQTPTSAPDWSQIYADLDQPIHLDIGCARGRFVLSMAQIQSDWNFLGLDSNNFNEKGEQIGRLDDTQLEWLKGVLATATEDVILVMIHHNVVEHLPGQSQHKMGRRYMLENAPQLLEILRPKVQLVFTGHLHVQDIAFNQGIYDITTGSLVSYPHPYRILHFRVDELGRKSLQVESNRVDSLPEWPDLPHVSREWMGDRSLQFMLRLLTEPPLSLPIETAHELAPSLRYFWADIAAGDGMFDYPNFPPKVRRFFQSFSATGSDRTPAMIDNYATLLL
jgi:hypothetical protein